jgi:hypothetical protein
MGWREFSTDVRHWAFWLALGSAALAALGFAWWSYLERLPPLHRAVIALATAPAGFVLFFVLALVGHKYFGHPSQHPFFPETATISAGNIRTRQVTVFAHDDAIEKNRRLPDRVAGMFRDAGWQVELSRTGVIRHANGVWVHGGTKPDQSSAVWGLKTLGLSAQIDDSPEDVGLQVIVGAVQTEEQTAASPTPNPPKGPAPTRRLKESDRPNAAASNFGSAFVRAQQTLREQEDKRRAEASRRLQLVTLEWGEHSAGLILQGVSHSPDILVRVTCTIIGLSRWSREHGRYAQPADHYPNGQFERLQLSGGRGDMGLDDRVNFGFIHFSPGKLDVEGTSDHKYIVQPGIWKLDCRLDDAHGGSVQKTMCLEWLNKSMAPTGLAECP